MNSAHDNKMINNQENLPNPLSFTQLLNNHIQENTLDLSNTEPPITDAMLPEILEFLNDKKHTLIFLNLADQPISDAGAKLIAEATLDRCIQVNLSRTKLSDLGLEFLSKSNNISGLDIEGNAISHQGLITFSKNNQGKIQRLNIKKLQPDLKGDPLLEKEMMLHLMTTANLKMLACGLPIIPYKKGSEALTLTIAKEIFPSSDITLDNMHLDLENLPKFELVDLLNITNTLNSNNLSATVPTGINFNYWNFKSPNVAIFVKNNKKISAIEIKGQIGYDNPALGISILLGESRALKQVKFEGSFFETHLSSSVFLNSYANPNLQKLEIIESRDNEFFNEILFCLARAPFDFTKTPHNFSEITVSFKSGEVLSLPKDKDLFFKKIPIFRRWCNEVNSYQMMLFNLEYLYRTVHSNFVMKTKSTHNWAHLSPLIVFNRANRDHSFRDSGRPLIPMIAKLAGNYEKNNTLSNLQIQSIHKEIKKNMDDKNQNDENLAVITMRKKAFSRQLNKKMKDLKIDNNILDYLTLKTFARNPEEMDTYSIDQLCEINIKMLIQYGRLIQEIENSSHEHSSRYSDPLTENWEMATHNIDMQITMLHCLSKIQRNSTLLKDEKETAPLSASIIDIAFLRNTMMYFFTEYQFNDLMSNRSEAIEFTIAQTLNKPLFKQCRDSFILYTNNLLEAIRKRINFLNDSNTQPFLLQDNKDAKSIPNNHELILEEYKKYIAILSIGRTKEFSSLLEIAQRSKESLRKKIALSYASELQHEKSRLDRVSLPYPDEKNRLDKVSSQYSDEKQLKEYCNINRFVVPTNANPTLIKEEKDLLEQQKSILEQRKSIEAQIEAQLISELKAIDSNEDDLSKKLKRLQDFKTKIQDTPHFYSRKKEEQPKEMLAKQLDNQIAKTAAAEKIFIYLTPYQQCCQKIEELIQRKSVAERNLGLEEYATTTKRWTYSIWSDALGRKSLARKLLAQFKEHLSEFKKFFELNKIELKHDESKIKHRLNIMRLDLNTALEEYEPIQKQTSDLNHLLKELNEILSECENKARGAFYNEHKLNLCISNPKT